VHRGGPGAHDRDLPQRPVSYKGQGGLTGAEWELYNGIGSVRWLPPKYHLLTASPFTGTKARIDRTLSGPFPRSGVGFDP
jgi:hypothetical protein